MQRTTPLLTALAVLSLACSSAEDDAAMPDGGAPSDDAAVHSPACTISQDSARCDTRTIEMIGGRRVYWSTPTKQAPEAGWPAVILYQGSLYGPALSWGMDLPRATMFGGYFQLVLIDELLDHGFVVVQPEAEAGRFWLGNTGGNYDTTSDAAFIPELLAAIEDGTFGAVDVDQLYATGISSGGYMTSRMAVSYPGKFRALAIQSASYATCLGPLCTVPKVLPVDHPPTLLLHGAKDTIVPIATARTYYDALVAAGIETKLVEDPAADHAWLEVSPGEIVAWFEAH